MTRNELTDIYFHEYLKWCIKPPEGSSVDLLFWLDNHHPNEDCFWEWMVHYEKGKDAK